MACTRIVSIGCIVGIAASVAQAQWAQNYSFQRLGLTDAFHTGPGGIRISSTVGMNDVGQVIGTSRWWFPGTNNGLSSAWAWTIDAGLLRIGPFQTGLPSKNVIPIAQSSAGVVVGNVTDANNNPDGQAWIWNRQSGLQSVNLGNNSTAQGMTLGGTGFGTANFFGQGRRCWFWRSGVGVVEASLATAPHVAPNNARDADCTMAIDTQDASSSWIIGSSMRFDSSSQPTGSSAWVRNTASQSSIQIGLYSPPYQDQSGIFSDYSAIPLSVNAQGRVAGYNRLSSSFNAAWSWSPETGITTPIGLMDAEHTGLSASWRSGLANVVTSSGLVLGWQTRFNGGFAERGLSTYAWVPSSNTYFILGLQDAEHTSENGDQWSIGSLSHGDHVAGYSYRYVGNSQRGQSVWYWSASTGVRRIGLVGSEYLNSDTGERNSGVTAIGSDGVVLGYSIRYQPYATTDWMYDPATNSTTIVPSVPLTQPGNEWAADRLITGTVADASQSGAAWLPQLGSIAIQQLVAGGMPGFTSTSAFYSIGPLVARHMPGHAGTAFAGTGTTTFASTSLASYVMIPPTTPITCNDIDFNNDGSLFDPMDIDAFLSVYGEGPCIPVSATCDSIDFNNDTSIFDPCDISSFLQVYGEGPCTLCGV